MLPPRVTWSQPPHPPPTEFEVHRSILRVPGHRRRPGTQDRPPSRRPASWCRRSVERLATRPTKSASRRWSTRPGWPRTLTPREPTREPNGQSLWFGAELDPDGDHDQVWFRIAEVAIGRMPEKTPGDRCRMLVDALIVWITLDRPLEPGINRFEVRGLQPRPGPWWPPPASARPRPPTASPRRRSPRTPAGRTPALCAASTPGSPAGRSRTRPWPATSPSSTSRGELRRARRRRWPRRASGPASPARRVRPGNERARILAGYRRTAVERGRGQARPFGAADLTAVLASCHRRRRRRGRGVESDEVVLKRGRLDAVIAGLLFMAGLRRSEVSALRWADSRRVCRRRRDAGDGPPRQDEPGWRDEGRAVREGRRRPRAPDAAVRREPVARGPGRAALAADGGAAVPGVGAGVGRRGAGNRPLGSCRAGVGAGVGRRRPT